MKSNIKRFILEEFDTEPLSVVEEQPKEEVVDSALVSLINSAIANEFTSIDTYKSYKQTFESEKPEFKEAQDILDKIIEEKQIQTGMLTKILELLNSNEASLMNAGVEKAEEIIDGGTPNED